MEMTFFNQLYPLQKPTMTISATTICKTAPNTFWQTNELLARNITDVRGLALQKKREKFMQSKDRQWQDESDACWIWLWKVLGTEYH